MCRLRWIALLLPALALALAGQPAPAAPTAVLVVNNGADVNDFAPGDGVCESAPGNQLCSLRAAVQEASANPNADIISLPGGFYALSRSGEDDTGLNGDLDISATVTLQGAGAATTIIDASAITDRVFEIITGTVTLSGVTIQNGTVASGHKGGGAGGGLFIHFGARVTVAQAAITGNHGTLSAVLGGGILNRGVLTLTQSYVGQNSITGGNGMGGGISDNGPGLVIIDSEVSENSVSGNGYGGGLLAVGGLTIISGSTFSENEAWRGGGIAMFLSVQDLDVRLINSTLSGNTAERTGGGLYTESGPAALHNVTVTGNYANVETDGSYAGGGVAVEAAGTVRLVNSIVAGNGRFLWPGPVLANSDCAGTLNALGPNLVGSLAAPCTLTGPAPLTGFAHLGPLADNGVGAPTHALLANSPAIDAGATPHCLDPLGATLTRDQRGVPRPQRGAHSLRCDLGAYEFVGPVFAPLVSR